MRSLRPIALAGLAALTFAACAGGGEPTWTYAPAPSPTPVVVPSVAPCASAAPGASAAPSADASAPAGQALIEISAQNIKFDKATMQAPAGQAFQIKFVNNDAGIPHNVAIKDANGNIVFDGEVFNGVDTKVYDVPALGAGEYQFYCKIHPNMVGTLSVG
jgi:plastocyanin